MTTSGSSVVDASWEVICTIEALVCGAILWLLVLRDDFGRLLDECLWLLFDEDRLS